MALYGVLFHYMENPAMTRMSPSEAMVETLRTEGVTVIPGLVGSAFMDVLDLFPAAGIRFLPVRHEQTAGHIADAYARVSGRPSVCIGQNGPGITNMVTSIAASYLAHSPVVVVTPSVTTASRGLDGFQEVDQLAIFRGITRYQVQVSRPERVAEAFRSAFRVAIAERGPVQVDIPRDFFYGECDVEILEPPRYRSSIRGPGDPALLRKASELLQEADRPVIISGMGVVESEAYEEVIELAELMGAPVVTSYLHNDAFPADHPYSLGPTGYQGSQAAMKMLSEADVLLAIGTRLSVFGTLPQYGMDYFPRTAKIIQIDIDPRQIGRVWPVEIGIMGDARAAAGELVRELKAVRANNSVDTERISRIQTLREEWEKDLAARSSSNETPISPRRALAELASSLSNDAIVTTDIGNICSVANSYLRFTKPRTFIAALSFGNCGFAYPAALGAKLARPDSPVVAIVGDGAWGMSLHEVMTAVEENLAVVAVVFNNREWGAEKKNQIDYYDRRFIGTNIGNQSLRFDFSGIAEAMGALAIQVSDPSELKEAYATALDAGRPVVCEVIVDPEELAEPFRRDALRRPKRYLPRYESLTVVD